jgi:hypothetical protein
MRETEGQANSYLTMPDEVRVELQEDQMLSVEVADYYVYFLTPQCENWLDWSGDVFGFKKRPCGTIETTMNAPGMNLSFGNAPEERVAMQNRSRHSVNNSRHSRSNSTENSRQWTVFSSRLSTLPIRRVFASSCTKATAITDVSERHCYLL